MLRHQATPLKLVQHVDRFHGTKLGARVSNCQATLVAEALLQAAAVH
jgi:hypothetical protein